MKYITRFLFVVLLFSSSIVTGQVAFQKVESWDQLLIQAKKEKKMIFLDAYTDWCGWCKVMDKNTFSKKEVGDTMHQYFIPIKLEMQKTELGRQIAIKYSIRGFPSFLVFDFEGNMIKQWFGYQAPEDFLPKLSEWIHYTPHTMLPGYNKGFDVKYHPEYLKLFAKSDGDIAPDSLVVTQFFLSNDSYDSEENWVMAKTFYWWMPEETMQKIIDQKQAITKQFGKENFDAILADYFGIRLDRLIKNGLAENDNHSTILSDLLSPLVKHHSRGHILVEYYYLNFYQESGQYDRVIGQVQRLKSKGEVLGLGMINEVCWEIYLNSENETVIKSAIQLIQEFYPGKMGFNELDTYAALLYKSKNYAMAKKVATEAIEKGEKDSSDIKATQKLLQNIEKALILEK